MLYLHFGMGINLSIKFPSQIHSVGEFVKEKKIAKGMLNESANRDFAS